MKTTSPYSDPQLITLLKQKDKGAWEYIFDKYGPALYGLTSSILPQTADAIAAFEESFLHISGSIENYDPAKSRLFTWLLQVTRETALHKRRSIPVMAPAARTQAPGKGFEELAQSLNEDQRELVRLVYFEGCSTGEVAGRLNIPAEQVLQKIRFALTKMNTSRSL